MNRRPSLPIYFALATMASAACSANSGETPTSQYRVVKNLFPDSVQAVDLLFVIDDSNSMRENQESLAAWAENELFGVLGMPDGSPLDLHVAVVSTNVGAGSFAIAGCEADGDNGRFLQGSAGAACSSSGPFLIDVDDGIGGRTQNFTGTLGEAFACHAQLGVSGCGFEQPLEAMKRALDGSNSENANFLRPEALLAVVVVSDEDDCSAADNEVFNSDASFDAADSTLGPLSSFRCFDFGVECATDDLRTPGVKTDCVARENSPYLASIDGYVTFLETLKGDASMVYAAGIFGDTDSIHVSSSYGEPRLDPSCSSPAGSAHPGVRLQSFLGKFPDRNRFASVCSENMSGPLATTAAGINAAVGRDTCLQGSVADVQLAEPGVQAECLAVATRVTDGEQVDLPACSAKGAGPCYRLIPDLEACSATPSTLAMDLSSAGDLAQGHSIKLSCLVD